MTKYEFTPNQMSLPLILIISFILYNYEIQFIKYLFGTNWYSVLIVMIVFFITPYVIWWLIGLLNRLILKINEKL